MTISPPLADMLLFVAVVSEGGFTAAAKKHGATKQAVSERIARLEAHLGVRLLERTTRRVRPTDIGAVYFERCRRIGAQVDEANQEAMSRQAVPSGLLRISAPYLFGRRLLSPVVATFMAAHPAVTVELVLGDRRVDLVEDGFDLAVRVGALDDSSLTSRRLGEVRVSAVASPALVARTPLRSPEALARTPCIGMRRSEEWVLDGRRHAVRPKLVVNDLEIASSAAVAGLGVAHLPELVTGEHIRKGRLARVLEATPSFVPIFAIYPSRQFLPAKVRSFLEVLATHLAIAGIVPARRPSAEGVPLGESRRRARR